MNWRGRPLTSHEVVVDLIGATTTRTGLTAHAETNINSYPRGIKGLLAVSCGRVRLIFGMP